jgi:tetratricopeptide (TPR) repeat protein
MAKWSIVYPKIEEDTPSKLVIASGSFTRRTRILVMALLAIAGAVGMLVGIMGKDIYMSTGAVMLCILPALAIGIAVPVTVRLVSEWRLRRIIISKQHLLGIGQWPRTREVSFNLSDIVQVAHKPNLTGSAHSVTVATSHGDQIVLQYGSRRTEAESMANKIAEALGPAFSHVKTDAERVEEPPPPASRWRLGAAAIYGLVAALILGHLWALLVTKTGTKFGYASIVLGLIVGVVVNIIGSGNKDIRYSILGAVLSGISIAFGEFLIFGLPEGGYIYQFDPTDLFIYAFAIYEGWIIPHRSFSITQRFRRFIQEENRIQILAVGLAAMLVVLGVSIFSGRLPTPTDAQAKSHFARGTVLAEEGRYEEAITEYEEAIRLKPNYALAYNDLGTVHYDMGELIDAKEMFDKAVQFDPKLPIAHANLAVVLGDLGRYDEGMSEAEEALHLDANLPQAHMAFGFLHFAQYQIPEAQIAFQKTLELDSSLPDPYFMLGLVYAEQGEWTLAIENLTKLLDIITEQEWRAITHYIRGVIFIETEQVEEAITDLETALELGIDPELRQEIETTLEDLKQ